MRYPPSQDNPCQFWQNDANDDGVCVNCGWHALDHDSHDWDVKHLSKGDVEKAIEKTQVGGRPEVSHYQETEFEPIDVMKAWSEVKQETPFNCHCRLTAVKYLSRAGRKDDYLADIEKARNYLNFILEGKYV